MSSWIDGAGGAPSAPAQHTDGLFTRCHIYLTRLQQNEQRPGARPRRSPARRGALRLPACCLCNWGPRAPLTTPLAAPAPQAVRAARPRQQAAARAPARALYFHSRQSVIAAAAEVGGPLACLAAAPLPPLLPPLSRAPRAHVHTVLRLASQPAG